MKYIAIVLALLQFASIASAQSREMLSRTRAATVRIGGCSAVILDTEGLILTAKHCKHPDGRIAHLADGRKVKVRKIYETPQSDGPAIYDLEGSGYSGIGIAMARPRFGKYYTWGHPAGVKEPRFASGRMLRVANVSGTRFNSCDFPVAGGWSGGGLFTVDSGECVGCAIFTDDRNSLWSSWAETRRVYREAVRRAGLGQGRPDGRQPDGFNKQGELIVVSTADCIPCRKLKIELTRYERNYNIHYVRPDSRGPMLAAFVRRFPRWDRAVPVVWRWGAKSYIEGFPNPMLAGYLSFECPDCPPPIINPIPPRPLQPIPDPAIPLPTPTPLPPQVSPADLAAMEARIMAAMRLQARVPGPRGLPGTDGRNGLDGKPGPTKQEIALAISAAIESNPSRFRGPAGSNGRGATTESIVKSVLAVIAQNPDRFRGKPGANGINGRPGPPTVTTLPVETVREIVLEYMQNNREVFRGPPGPKGSPGKNATGPASFKIIPRKPKGQ